MTTVYVTTFWIVCGPSRHLRHLAAERGAGEGGDGEGDVLAGLDAADIALVDAGPDLDAAQVLGDAEQLGRLEAGGDGLADIDAALDDDAVDRCPDLGAVEIDLHLLHRRLALGDLGLRRGDLRLADLEGGAGRILRRDRGLELRLGRDQLRPRRLDRGLRAVGVGGGAGAAAEQLALALVVAFGVLHDRLGAHDVRAVVGDIGARRFDLGAGAVGLGALHDQACLGGLDVRARLRHPRVDLVGIEPCDHLARLDLGVEVGEQLPDLAGELRADQHGDHRVDRPGRRHRADDRTGIDFGKAVAGRRLGLRQVVEPGDRAACQQQQRRRQREAPQSDPRERSHCSVHAAARPFLRRRRPSR